MRAKESNTPCPVSSCHAERYPHALLCWEHWCDLPTELRAQLEQVEPAQLGGSRHLALAKQALNYYRRENAA